MFPDGYIDQTSYDTLSPCFGTSLERDSGTLDLSGIPLSNSRTLAIQAQFSDSSLKNYSFYLQHVALCRVFLNTVRTLPYTRKFIYTTYTDIYLHPHIGIGGGLNY